MRQANLDTQVQQFFLAANAADDADPQSLRQHDSRYWLISPLDETQEFIACNGGFTFKNDTSDRAFFTHD